MYPEGHRFYSQEEFCSFLEILFLSVLFLSVLFCSAISLPSLGGARWVSPPPCAVKGLPMPCLSREI